MKVLILKNQNHSRVRFGYVFVKRAAPQLYSANLMQFFNRKLSGLPGFFEIIYWVCEVLKYEIVYRDAYDKVSHA